MREVNKTAAGTSQKGQGAMYDAPAALGYNYYRPEPRNVEYWLRQILYWTKEGLLDDFEGFLPDIDVKLLARYVLNPLNVRPELTPDQLTELEKPQRIVLFYFLRRLAAFEGTNRVLTDSFKNQVAEQLGFTRRETIPEEIVAFIATENLDYEIDIVAGSEVQAYVDSQPEPIIFHTDTNEAWKVSALNGIYSSAPIGKNGELKVDYYPPEADGEQQHLHIHPFKPHSSNESDPHLCNVYQPTLAVATPTLYLSGGNRVINLIMLLDEPLETVPADELFSYRISISSGWRSIQPVQESQVSIFGYSFFYTRFELPPDFPAITTIDSAPFTEFAESVPSLLISTEHPEIQDFLSIGQMLIQVDVCDLLPDVVRNQETVLSSKGGYELFGSEAPIDSVFSFSHIELSRKILTSVAVKPSWVGKPDDLHDYYKAYDKTTSDFTVTPAVVYRQNRENSSAQPELFSRTGIPIEANFPTEPSGFDWLPDEADPLLQPLYFQLALTGTDFGQAEYPLLMSNYVTDRARRLDRISSTSELIIEEAEKLDLQPGAPGSEAIKELLKITESGPTRECVEQLKSIKADLESVVSPPPLLLEIIGLTGQLIGFLREEPDPVNLPYLPTVDSMQITYTASDFWINPGGNENSLALFTLCPVGYKTYRNRSFAVSPDESLGAIYLGFNGIKSGKRSNVYLQGPPGHARTPLVRIRWQYLTDQGWSDLQPEDLDDQTYGLTQAGILNWRAPPDLSTQSTIMPQGIAWLRAITDPTETLPPDFWRAYLEIVEVRSNALFLRRFIDENTSGVLQADAKLTFTEHPYTLIDFYETTGSVPAESNLEFWARSFSRLRFKNRAVSAEDYEDLILYDFPTTRQVTTLRRKSDNRVVKSVLVPRDRLTTNHYPLRPRFSRHFLDSVKQKLYQHVTSFALPNQFITLEVTNPDYIDVGFRIVISFCDDVSEKEGKNRLLRDLKSYVNPWRSIKNAQVYFGCWFEYGSFLSYLSNLDYVKAVLRLKLDIADGNHLCPPQKYAINPDEVPILIESKVEIDVIKCIEDYNPADYEGIGYMIIGTDFYAS